MDVDAARELRLDLEDAFLRNELSATRLSGLVQKTVKCGLPHFSQLQKICCGGVRKNLLKRNFLRLLRRRKAWVPLFYSKVPLVGNAEHELPFLLPHLILHKMAQKDTNWDDFKPQSHHVQVLQTMREIADDLEMDWHSVVPLGFHGDGTPYGRSKQDPLEVSSLNFLCARQEKIAKLRMPLFIIKTDTWRRKHLKSEYFRFWLGHSHVLQQVWFWSLKVEGAPKNALWEVNFQLHIWSSSELTGLS